MPDDLRQELLVPFFTRLAGTADSSEIEVKRAMHIVVQIVKRILPIALRAANLRKPRCEEVDSAAAAAITNAAAAHTAVVYAKAADVAAADAAAANTIYAAYDDYAAYAISNAISNAANVVANAVAAANADRKEIFTVAAAILDEAIRFK
jgi:hypothetical protein